MRVPDSARRLSPWAVAWRLLPARVSRPRSVPDRYRRSPIDNGAPLFQAPAQLPFPDREALHRFADRATTLHPSETTPELIEDRARWRAESEPRPRECDGWPPTENQLHPGKRRS